jgi:hypothetical protein
MIFVIELFLVVLAVLILSGAILFVMRLISVLWGKRNDPSA